MDWLRWGIVLGVVCLLWWWVWVLIALRRTSTTELWRLAPPRDQRLRPSWLVEPPRRRAPQHDDDIEVVIEDG
jgi:hypothetical protein